MTDFNDYTEIRGIKYYNWVKRIKQAHLAGKNSSTLCGMAMLGSNYARHFEQQHWNLDVKNVIMLHKVLNLMMLVN